MSSDVTPIFFCRYYVSANLNRFCQSVKKESDLYRHSPKHDSQSKLPLNYNIYVPDCQFKI